MASAIATGLAALSLAVWVYLIALRGGFWLANQRLGRCPPPSRWPGVVAILQARNEARTVAASLQSLLAQVYAGPFSIILVDDASTDATVKIARQLAASGPAGGRLEVLSAPPLAPGWTGKPWALSHGVVRAFETAPSASYLFLTDADTVHAPTTLGALVAKAEAEGRDLVSLLVRLHCERLWERLLIPAFVFFFQKLYPFGYVNDDGRGTAAAAGACIIVRRRALERAGGIDEIRAALIDDLALARAIKRTGGRLWLGLADASRSLRTYDRLADLWHMVARTAYAELRYSPPLLLGCVIAMGVTYLAPPLVLLALPLHSGALAAVAAALAWALMAAAYTPTLAYYRQPRALAVALPLAAALFLAMTLDSARRHGRGEGGRWKARTVGRNRRGGA